MDLEFCRKYCEYIVVYNYEVNKKYVEDEKQKLEEKTKSQTVDREYMKFANTISKYAKEELVLWNLNIMKDICVSDIHTYDTDKFKDSYTKKHIL